MKERSVRAAVGAWDSKVVKGKHSKKKKGTTLPSDVYNEEKRKREDKMRRGEWA